VTGFTHVSGRSDWSWAIVYIDADWWQNASDNLARGMISHEVGHFLGLADGTDGSCPSNSIMHGPYNCINTWAWPQNGDVSSVLSIVNEFTDIDVEDFDPACEYQGVCPAGEDITYQIRVENRGPAADTSTVIAFNWSAPLEIRSISTTRGSCVNNSGQFNITCYTGFWGPGNNVIITVVGRPSVSTTLNLSVTASPTQLDLNTGNNYYNGQQTITPSANLVMQFMSTTQPAAQVGSPFTLLTSIRNNGPSPAQSPIVRVTLPFGIRFLSGSGCVPVGGTRDVNCSIATLGNGASVQVPMQVVAGRRGSFAMSGLLQSSTYDPNAGNNAGSINFQPAQLSGCAGSGIKGQLNVTQSGTGIAVTVTAGTTGVPGNRLEGIQFVGGSPYVGGQLALIDIVSVIGQTVGYYYPIETEPSSQAFTVRRSSAGPMTVGLRVDDHCGSWTTFVGRGS
jgi:uncharacterized repeat protein (TIGR01451 family)